MSWSCSTYQVQLVENSLDLFINWSVVQPCFHWPDKLMCWGDWAEQPQHFPDGHFLGHVCLDRFLPVHELWGRRNLLQRFCITVYDFYGKMSSLHVVFLPFFFLLGDLTAISAWIPAFMVPHFLSLLSLRRAVCPWPSHMRLGCLTAVWRAVPMVWSDWGLSRCVGDPRSLGFPATSSNGNNKLGLGLPGSCLYAGKPGSPHTPGTCRVLTVGMSWVPWAAWGYWGLWPRYPHSSAVLPTFKEEILPIKPFYYRFGFTGNAEPRWEENQAFHLKECNGILSCPLNYSSTSILNVWFISSKRSVHCSSIIFISQLTYHRWFSNLNVRTEMIVFSGALDLNQGEAAGAFEMFGCCGDEAWGAWVDGWSATCVRLSGAANFSFAVDYEGKTEASENFFSFSVKTLRVALP